jgi:hypothetical protein
MNRTLESDYRALCLVKFPEYADRQKYMHTFDASNPHMEKGFEGYLEPVSKLLLAAGIHSGECHMTVDEKIIDPGMSQRRPGPHVDGCFMPAKNAWGHTTGWLHNCNDLGIGKSLKRMAVIVASTVSGCRAWKGSFAGTPKDDGDLSHISGQLGEGEVLPANQGFLLSPDCVHESMKFDRPTKRQFLRIAFHQP